MVGALRNHTVPAFREFGKTLFWKAARDHKIRQLHIATETNCSNQVLSVATCVLLEGHEYLTKRYGKDSTNFVRRRSLGEA